MEQSLEGQVDLDEPGIRGAVPRRVQGPRGQAGVPLQTGGGVWGARAECGVSCVLNAEFCALSHVEASEWRHGMKSSIF